MELDEYLVLIAEKIKRAAISGDKEEAIRLIQLVIEVSTETVSKLKGE